MASYNRLEKVPLYTLKIYEQSLQAEMNNVKNSSSVRKSAKNNLSLVRKEMKKRNAN